eukprot:340156_1
MHINNMSQELTNPSPRLQPFQQPHQQTHQQTHQQATNGQNYLQYHSNNNSNNNDANVGYQQQQAHAHHYPNTHQNNYVQCTSYLNNQYQQQHFIGNANNVNINNEFHQQQYSNSNQLAAHIPTDNPTQTPTNNYTQPSSQLFPTFNPTVTHTNNPTPVTISNTTNVPTDNIYQTVFPTIIPSISSTQTFELFIPRKSPSLPTYITSDPTEVPTVQSHSNNNQPVCYSPSYAPSYAPSVNVSDKRFSPMNISLQIIWLQVISIFLSDEDNIINKTIYRVYFRELQSKFFTAFSINVYICYNVVQLIDDYIHYVGDLTANTIVQFNIEIFVFITLT